MNEMFWLRVVDEGKRRLSRDARRETLPSIDSKDLLPTTWGGGQLRLTGVWPINDQYHGYGYFPFEHLQ